MINLYLKLGWSWTFGNLHLLAFTLKSKISYINIGHLFQEDVKEELITCCQKLWCRSAENNKKTSKKPAETVHFIPGNKPPDKAASPV